MTQIYPGWYRVSAGGVPEGNLPGAATAASKDEIRWWSGSYWMAYTVAGDKIRTQGAAFGPSWFGFTFGAIFILMSLGLIPAVMTTESAWAFLLLLPTFFLGVSMVVAAMMVRRREKLPPPSPHSTSLWPAVTLPRPGEAEGPNAGWYPAPTPLFLRWWTGTRWAEYGSDGKVVRPTMADVRSYAQLRWTALGAVIFTVVALLVAIFVPPAMGFAIIGVGFGILVSIFMVPMWLATKKRYIAAANPPPMGPPRPLQLSTGTRGGRSRG